MRSIPRARQQGRSSFRIAGPGLQYHGQTNQNNEQDPDQNEDTPQLRT